jgi:hypothetical protein
MKKAHCTFLYNVECGRVPEKSVAVLMQNDNASAVVFHPLDDILMVVGRFTGLRLEWPRGLGRTRAAGISWVRSADRPRLHPACAAAPTTCQPFAHGRPCREPYIDARSRSIFEKVAGFVDLTVGCAKRHYACA